MYYYEELHTENSNGKAIPISILVLDVTDVNKYHNDIQT